MPSLSKLWLALDSLGLPATSHAQWQQLLGEDLPRAQPLLAPEDRIAASVPDPRNPHCWFDVQWQYSDRYLGINAWTGEYIALPRQDVLVHRLCVKRLADELCSQLELDPMLSAITGVPHTWRIATYTPLAGYEFPVYLTLNLQSLDSVPVLEGIAAETDGPFILFAPTKRKLSAQGEAMLRRRGARLLTLDECLETDAGDRPVVTDAGRQRLAEFRRSQIPDTTKKVVPDSFPTPAGAQWRDVRIQFLDGETVSISVRGVTRRYIYSQMGFKDGRNCRANFQWELLRMFAKGRGSVTWDSSGACDELRGRKRELKKALQAFFRIEGDPFEQPNRQKGWRALFWVGSDSVVAGQSW